MEYLGKQAAPLHGLSGNTQQHDFSKKTQKKKDSDGFAGQNSALLPVSKDSDTLERYLSGRRPGALSADISAIMHSRKWGIHTMCGGAYFFFFASKPSLQAP